MKLKCRRGTRAGIVVCAMLALLVATPGVAVAAKTPPTHRIPESIPHDCSRDVTAGLTDWIRRVPNASTISFAQNGCYRIDGSLIVQDRSGLIFEGNGATLRAVAEGNQARRHVWFMGGNDLVVRDLTVQGANPHGGASPEAYVPQRAFQHAFSLIGVVNALLENVQAYDVYGDFVYIGSGGPHDRWSENIRITGSRFERSGRQGISIAGGKTIVIDHNTIRDVARSMFDLEANTAAGGALDVRVTHNVTGAAVNFWLANKGAGTLIRNITFTDNRMTQATGGLVFVFGPQAGYRGPFVFERNTLLVGDKVHDEGSKGAFFLSRAADVTIRDNTATFPAGHDVAAVELQDTKNVQVQANTFKNAGPKIIETVRAPKA